MADRRAAHGLADMKEKELSWLEAQAYHILYRCRLKCYIPTDPSYYLKEQDLACDNQCLADFISLQLDGFQKQALSQARTKKETCLQACFLPKAGSTDQQYCIE